MNSRRIWNTLLGVPTPYAAQVVLCRVVRQTRNLRRTGTGDHGGYQSMDLQFVVVIGISRRGIFQTLAVSDLVLEQGDIQLSVDEGVTGWRRPHDMPDEIHRFAGHSLDTAPCGSKYHTEDVSDRPEYRVCRVVDVGEGEIGVR